MKLSLLAALSFGLASAADAATTFQASSPIPAQLQGQISQAVAAACPGLQALQEANTNSYDYAGETYFETTLAGAAKPVTVISAIARMGGMDVVKVDCGE